MSRINGNHQPQEPQAVNGRVSIASTRALTRQYMGTMPTMHNRPRDLPPLNADLIRAMLLDSAVRLGLAMRAAPLMASEIAYKDGDKWTPGVRAEIPEVGEFIRRQYARIWLNGLESILTGQIWGWASGEVMLRTTRIGTVEVDYLLPRSAMDTRVLISDGEVAGCRVLKVKDVGHVDLKFPKGFFHAHRPEPGSHYGQSILLGCYSPWADKCFQGGALDVRRLFMHKDAYGGCDISYPDSTTIINGEEIPNRDIALQIVEQIQAGGVTTRPASYDVNGKEQWTITRATVPPSPGHILEYPKDLDTEIFHGMEIPDDVIESENGGAWAGKQVPMAAFYSSLDVWLISIIRDIEKQIIRPLLALNFRKPGAYEVTHKPLAVQASEQQQQAQQPSNGQQPGTEGGQMPGIKMGLDAEEAIGEGVLSAGEMVEAARRVMALRMNVTDDEGHIHAADGKFTNKPDGAGKPRKKTSDKPSAHPASAPPEQVDMDAFHRDYDEAHGDAQPHEDLLIKDLRERLPQYTPGQFNYGVRKLREQGYLTAESAHGGDVKGDELIDRKNHGIKEGNAPHQELVYLARRKRRDAATKMAAAHAPKGGVTVAGKQFTGGEFVPGELMEKAMDDEKSAVAGEKRPSVERLREYKHDQISKVSEDDESAVEDVITRSGIAAVHTTGKVPLLAYKDSDGNVVGGLVADTDGEFSFDLGVDPDSQGQGIGKALIQHAIGYYLRNRNKIAKRQGLEPDEYDLRVLASNPKVEAMMLAMGCEKDGEAVVIRGSYDG